ncbi:unnamed protein product [Pleuronectes platessa]|uniref:Uncharacterized protein n=1 Tax=Pleuronectes platessa TaxID=8262 RepID=A0A9N7YLA3_PLEPL|nr:unnamed protein product [Pleuronectes platessa]
MKDDVSDVEILKNHLCSDLTRRTVSYELSGAPEFDNEPSSGATRPRAQPLQAHDTASPVRITVRPGICFCHQSLYLNLRLPHCVYVAHSFDPWSLRFAPTETVPARLSCQRRSGLLQDSKSRKQPGVSKCLVHRAVVSRRLRPASVEHFAARVSCSEPATAPARVECNVAKPRQESSFQSGARVKEDRGWLGEIEKMEEENKHKGGKRERRETGTKQPEAERDEASQGLVVWYHVNTALSGMVVVTLT